MTGLRDSDLREWMNVTATKVAAVDESGGDSSIYRLQGKTMAGILALLEKSCPVDLWDAALNRGRNMMRNGEDWRRELRLYDNFNERIIYGRS